MGSKYKMNYINHSIGFKYYYKLITAMETEYLVQQDLAQNKQICRTTLNSLFLYASKDLCLKIV